MEYFYINKDSVNPTLRMELVYDARFEFLKTDGFNNAIQNSDITFTMWDENDKLRISKSPCNIILSQEACDDRYIIEYKWKKKDTKEKGQFKGRFEITFNDDLYEDGVTYPSGNLIMPIYEELTIFIK